MTREQIAVMLGLPVCFLFPTEPCDPFFHERVCMPMERALRRCTRAIGRLRRRFEMEVQIEDGYLDIGGEG